MQFVQKKPQKNHSAYYLFVYEMDLNWRFKDAVLQLSSPAAVLMRRNDRESGKKRRSKCGNLAE